MDQATHDSMFGLQVGYTTGRSFREITKWATFIAIVFFIGIGIFLLALIIGGTALLEAYSTQSGLGVLASGLGGVFLAVGIAFLAVYFFATFMLFRFASFMKSAVDNQDQQAFNNSLRSFKNFFVITGVLSILSFIYSIFTIVITIVPETISSVF